MGQYYKPLLIHEDGSRQSAYSHDFDNGLKLMEHSWVGNSFVNTVLGAIKDNPTRVAWLGDYSDGYFETDEYNLGGGFITSANKFLPLYQAVWIDKIKNPEITYLTPGDPKFNLDIDHACCYLVNVTKQCYIDLEEYVKENLTPKLYGSNEAWCINPLPLLTCLGNGLGGGDYRGELGVNDIGTWAFDEIYVTYLRPGNLEEVMYFFKE